MAGKTKWKCWFNREGKLDLAEVDQTSNSVLAIFMLDSAVDSKRGPGRWCFNEICHFKKTSPTRALER